MNRTDRLHAVHEAIRGAGPDGVTAARLASALEVSERTIKRDVSALQQAGAPIWARPGPGGGYVIDATASLPPVAFTPGQAVSVVVALAMLPPGSPLAVDGAAAAGKLLGTLGPAARARADALAERVWVLPADGADGAASAGRASPSVLRAVERSLDERVALTIDYADRHGNPSRRTVEPVMLAWAVDQWYVVAHCRRRDDIRWFRIDRVTAAWPTGQPYEPRPLAEVGVPPPGARPVGGSARDR